MPASLDSEVDIEEDSSADQAKAANKQLLHSLIETMLDDPEADLMALVPKSYFVQMRKRKASIRRRTSKLIDQNQRTIASLLAAFARDPYLGLVNEWSFDSYNRDRETCLKSKKRRKRSAEFDEELPPFYAIIDESNEEVCEALFPLSASMSATLQDSPCCSSKVIPADSIKRVIKQSECLWTGWDSFVAKTAEGLVVKVSPGPQTNHYQALQYLADNAPDVPAPRAHGLVQLGRVSALFMSHVSGHGLGAVWSTLTHEDKLSIQQQLDAIFTRIRQLSVDGRQLGTLNGEGVEDGRGITDVYRSQDPICSQSAFEEWLFSSRDHGSENYTRFLKSLLPHTPEDSHCVFTHSDVRPDNIIVDTDADGHWKVSGIIDWEDAGFYPRYWEAIKATALLQPREEKDWYLYIPACIAPSSYAQQWLVDRELETTRKFMDATKPPPSKLRRIKHDGVV